MRKKGQAQKALKEESPEPQARKVPAIVPERHGFWCRDGSLVMDINKVTRR